MEVWFDKKTREVRVIDGDGRYLRIGMVSVGDKRELGVINAPAYNDMARDVFESGEYGEKVWEEPGYHKEWNFRESEWVIYDPEGKEVATCKDDEKADMIIAMFGGKERA